MESARMHVGSTPDRHPLRETAEHSREQPEFASFIQSLPTIINAIEAMRLRRRKANIHVVCGHFRFILSHQKEWWDYMGDAL